MTIGEAIEIITELRREDRYSFDRKTIHALRLGIEALKRIKSQYDPVHQIMRRPLPGETKEWVEIKMQKSDFKEVGRVRTSDSTEVVLSELYRDRKFTGYSITKYVTSDEYTGWSKGVYIPEDMIIDFLKLSPKDDLEFALKM